MRHALLRPLLEAGIVVLLGLSVGLIANAADDKYGMALQKDHLRRGVTMSPHPTAPGAMPVAPAEPTASPATSAPGGTHADSPFTFIEHETAREIQQGEAYQYGDDIFIDARDDAHYAECHIPGAYQLDHFRIDRYLPDVLPVCQAAQRIVIYCNGGSCEDSRLAAEDLMMEGVDPAKLLIYEGGITEWRAANLPLEAGERLSGQPPEGEN